MKKILMCTAAATMLAGSAFADNGAYVGFGLGNTFANISNKTNASAYDEGISTTEYHSFGNRRLKDKTGTTGKLYAGYEYEMQEFSLLFEGGYTLDTSEAEYGNETSGENNLELDGTLSSVGRDANDPVITSMKLKRNHIVSVGMGIKKEVAAKFSVMGGLDLLHSQFKFQSKGTADYTTGVNSVVKKKSKFGLAPWVGMSWDAGVVEAGLRYQYSRYQQLKTGGDYTPNKFNIANKIKPEYHTIMVTISKKI